MAHRTRSDRALEGALRQNQTDLKKGSGRVLVLHH